MRKRGQRDYPEYFWTEGHLDPCPSCDGQGWPYCYATGEVVCCTTCGGAGVYKMSGARATAFHCLRIARHLRKAAGIRGGDRKTAYCGHAKAFLHRARQLLRASIDDRLQTTFLPA